MRSTRPASAFRSGSSASMRWSSPRWRRRCCRARPTARTGSRCSTRGGLSQRRRRAAARRAPATDARVQPPPAGASRLRVAGSVATGGPPLAVMDIAGAQVALGNDRQDSSASTSACAPAPIARRCCANSRCRPACAPPRPAKRATGLERLARLPRQPHRARAGRDVHRRVPRSSRSCRSRSRSASSSSRCSACSACRRAAGSPSCLAESALLGVAGSVLGLALGTRSRPPALRLFGGDLGGGYFPRRRAGAALRRRRRCAVRRARRRRRAGRRLAAGARGASASRRRQALKGLGRPRRASPGFVRAAPARPVRRAARTGLPPMAEDSARRLRVGRAAC